MLVSMAELARQYDVEVTAVYRLVKDGRLAVEGEDASGRGRPAKLIDQDKAAPVFDELRQARHERRSSTKKLEEKFDADRAAGVPLPGMPIGIGEGARKYGVSPQLVSIWVKNGEVRVLREAAVTGGRRLIDEHDLMLRAQRFHERRSSTKKLEEKFDADRAAGVPLPGMPIGIGEGARKYGVSTPLVSQWVKNGEVRVLREAAVTGGRRLIDEHDLMLRAQRFHERKSARSLGRSPVGAGDLPREVSGRSRRPPARADEGSAFPCPHCGGAIRFRAG